MAGSRDDQYFDARCCQYLHIQVGILGTQAHPECRSMALLVGASGVAEDSSHPLLLFFVASLVSPMICHASRQRRLYHRGCHPRLI